MEMYIILKNGKPWSGVSQDAFAKIYYDKKKALQIAKSACTAEANRYYEYGEGYYQNEELSSTERRKLAKDLANKEWIKRWEVKPMILKEEQN
ncbi:hypothetical protein [Bacillus sp. NPDC094106]|uniref:hypothetical protein n=1 Tax=Bacillus sp. NPDC094106 TaxID=3363949 RepID=UPI0037F26B13